MQTVYLDNAATSFPKPPCVIDEITRCMRTYCGNPGRGSHALAMASAEKIFECREMCASFFGAEHPANVVFCQNATMALNTVIKGLLKDGDHVLLSDMEHNAVFRPVAKLASQNRISYDIFPTFPNDKTRSAAKICTAISRAVRENTKMLICTHVPNICSSVMPIAEIGALCRAKGIVFVVDAAQSAGHLPIDMQQMRIDVLCAPGHKGLLGPQGSGFFILGDGILPDTLLEGGSGLYSLESSMPAESPERYEAGTLSTPAIAGLLEGIKYVRQIGVSNLHKTVTELNLYLQNALEKIPNTELYAPFEHGAVLLFNKRGISAERLGQALNQCGFCVRAGYHCTALGHRTLQTPNGGAVRVSPSFRTTYAQIDAFAKAVAAVTP